ncbi:haloacid dehalogenase [Bifidobacterium pseudolongum subsp. globosum]|uniref:HAD-IC family P-type ATPase n=1 Tax=Bifidobacterium pseudolongum TaxID=1694 RepID=UPI00101F67D5|nr:HAD-IC family P-type ATPase [Bifidobacterium pseudolongum]RYQ04661.1 haloacid dehalogenase [Bifidobacterium pseudolongum subsp. globosum]RYQ09722.1 haloacid dehalogenase [Bifidobacterium pseudolongum subsp. globosum]RYQ12886.1 haloacid dehalogenase [Bifidobacterium pseudolongum subsp. globosum]RYQ15553.1 haloacid dehalogenase [Bifidobacterium pseudolongum subsp. globosum]
MSETTNAATAVQPKMPDVSERGLTAAQVEDRIERGQTNAVTSSTSRSLADIVRANVFTLFNGIILTAMVMVLIAGSWKDAVFGFVIIINTGIGIVTELRAKYTLDKLSILVASDYLVRRDGNDVEVSHNDIVLGDFIWLRSGEQVPADATIVQTWGLELDESMITGESRTVRKKEGDTVYSGSTAVSGMALVHVTAVGAHSYAATLTAQAKVYKKNVSDLNKGINTILKFMTFLVVPLCILLILTQMKTVGGWSAAIASGAWRQAVVSSVAGVVGMVPEGLVLLTSLNFALAAIRLARKNTLVQDLDSVETLARVDCLNLDKTGTITDGGIVYDDFIALPACASKQQAMQVLYDLANEESPNGTGRAVLAGLGKQGFTGSAQLERVPFSSARKWSAVAFRNEPEAGQGGVWYMGAPEVLLAGFANQYPDVLKQVNDYANNGMRVLLIAHAAGEVPADFETDPKLEAAAQPVAIVLCSEHIRDDAEPTLAWFREQGVRCRVISGDNPVTVGAIAGKVKLTGDRKPVAMDARELPQDVDELARVLENVDVLGRVLPEQKKAIVQALHTQKHVVAMTGDGVNDALAIKEADLGIAMGNAAPATKAVAEVVLVDSKFSHLPDVVARGRQVMANMERVASLFLTKTVYSALISFGVVLSMIPFPYLPRHISYIGALTIGAPAFLLALAPNTRRYIPGFLRRVFAFSVPCGIATALSVLLSAWFVPKLMGWNVDGSAQYQLLWRSMCATVLFVMGIYVLARVATPLNSWRGWLVAAFAAAGVIGMCIPFVAHFFAFQLPGGKGLLALGVQIVIATLLFALSVWLFPKFLPVTMRSVISQYKRISKR